MNNKITEKHFKNYLTCQPYFVWNSLDEKNIIEDEDEDSGIYWDISIDDEDDENNFVKITKKGFEIVKEKVQNFIIKKYENQKLFFVTGKTNEQKINQTKLFIENINDYDAILFPIFEYDEAIARPFLYDKNQKKLSIFKIGVSTKLNDYIKCFFDFSVAEKNNLEIEEITIFTIEEKNWEDSIELTFDETNKANTTKNSRKPKDKYDDVHLRQEAVLGEKEKETIIEKIRSGIINKEIVLKSFETYLKNIKDSKNIPLSKNLNDDNTSFGRNPQFKELLKKFYPQLPDLSGKLINVKNLLTVYENENDFNNLMKENVVTKYILEKKNFINNEVINEVIEKIKNNKVVWYDFEGFSLPFPIMLNTKPYQQLINQVSVIKTDNEKMINECENIVIDPKGISIEDFYKIIDAIYDPEASFYVVYNKSYEHSKLKDMKHVLIKTLGFTEKVNEYIEKIDFITNEEMTIDLLDNFNVSSAKNSPPIFLWELYGFSSIKKVEKFITQNKYQLEVLIAPYSSLEVQNGLMAMETAINRYLDVIGDEEWKTIQEDLKIYCENDVKAMLMVYFFIKEVYKGNIKL
ncbi:MAG: UU173 family protein [Metamycoplasmataceae bacterium]